MNDIVKTGTALALTQSYVPAGVESAATAVAAQAKAMVEARYTIALHRPRNWLQVRQDLLTECKRPSFANNKSTYYIKPIGAGVEGLGIRFVETALRCMTNVLIETTMIFEDEMKEVHRVSVTDLEANITYPMDIKVTKTVERNKLQAGQTPISTRKNSYGRDVFIVPGTDDDILNKRGALISKAVRTLGLRLIPGDLCDEAEATIKQVRLNEAAKDPGAEAKRISDAFAEIGVRADQLTEYLGHPLQSCSPKELVDLRGLYGAIKDGEATWQSAMENKATKQGDTPTAAKDKPGLSDEDFTKRSAGWKKQVQDGQSVKDVLATIGTRYSLTDDQKMEVASWAVPPAGATPDSDGVLV